MKAILVTFIFVVVLGTAFGQISTLPIELDYFNYQLTDSSVYLTWATATEVNNYGYKLPGTYLINFNASRLSSGIYFYSIGSGRNTQTRSMILLK